MLHSENLNKFYKNCNEKGENCKLRVYREHDENWGKLFCPSRTDGAFTDPCADASSVQAALITVDTLATEARTRHALSLPTKTVYKCVSVRRFYKAVAT